MRLSLKDTLFTAIAILAGLVVLSGYFIEVSFLTDLRLLFVSWAVLLTAVAVIVGVINLLRVHWGRIKVHQSGWFYSLVLVVCLLATLVIAAYFGPVSQPSMYLYNHILAPLEMSLMALLAVTLLMAAAKLLQRRLSGFSLIFIGVVVLVVLGTISIPGIELQSLREVKNWIAQTWAGAGARGILLGVALGTVATGIRVLLGVERPYRD